MMYKFEGERFYSSGVNRILNPELKSAIWLTLEEILSEYHELENTLTINLEAITINGEIVQEIMFKQNGEQIGVVKQIKHRGNPLQGIQVWIVDELKHVIMLFPSEK